MKCIITGISGQDGYFLSQFLLSKGYEIHGILRRKSSMTGGTVDFLPDNIRDQIIIHYGDLTDGTFLSSLLQKEKPEELYNLAAQNFLRHDVESVLHAYDANFCGTFNVCEAVKNSSPYTRMYFAATSEMFGQPKDPPQNELTPFSLRNDYAKSKFLGYWTVRLHRELYKLFMSNGILFNHESEIRSPGFVTRKIFKSVARIYHRSNEPVVLGSLSSWRDWGYAKDYVEGMWMMLQQDYPEDFVLGTGESHSVMELAEPAFHYIGINIRWKGSGLNEVGISDEGRTLVKVSREFFRPLESDNYMADYTQAKTKLGWEPKTKFDELVRIMVESDIKAF